MRLVESMISDPWISINLEVSKSFCVGRSSCKALLDTENETSANIHRKYNDDIFEIMFNNND